MLSGIKRNFFAMRNGILADALRKGGIPHKMIFGLQIPQIAEMARAIGRNPELAETLWSDREVRESRILATYLFGYSPEEISIDRAIELASDTRTSEEADMLAFRLFRNLGFAPELLERMRCESSVPEWAAVALARFLEDS